ncbi:hypothetical protein BJF92_11170 [Rhizobium rhizosphaerae]|uniref:Uncharacterized protein n=1 Tax=Xaviernesmea rhizosphaerae TaxID=1672749 RepID=A0A1Q9AMN7_9HYPH|nr:hypothetical protein [Xaviernesmea rhizosphaerae]OLP56644.1 hypothetical protein BJF92_11170 [Xaviernesmea rhizosphaerae]
MMARPDRFGPQPAAARQAERLARARAAERTARRRLLWCGIAGLVALALWMAGLLLFVGAL